MSPTPKLSGESLIKQPMRKVALVILTLLVAALVMGFVAWPASPMLLAQGNQLQKASVLQRWQAGEIVVLVRHAERCDQSSNPCLGPADGITEVGRDAARQVGQALDSLGLAHTDLLTSPATRTVQTAHYLSAHVVPQQEWLAACGATMGAEVLAHKTAQRNLVLVTHSGCISDFEAQNGFKNARKAEYTSALFAAVGPDGKLQILGTVNDSDWSSVLNNQVAEK